MNAQLLLEHYERIAEAPDAIAQLRRFILELAVHGKLVEQDPNDEPASELLKRIAAEKARLIKQRAIKKSEVPSISAEEEPYPVKANWAWARLGDIGDWGAGSTPPRGNADLYGGGITWLKSGELNDNRELAGSEETVTEHAVKTGSFRLNKPGDVLIAMYGATIGKLAILAEEAVTNQAVCGCTPFSGVSNQYLFLFLMSQREQFHGASEGGAQPNISKVKIVNTAFPLPPLAEQHRIIAKVDELMALCDQLETAQAELETGRNKLTLSILAKLNEPDPETFANDARFALEHLEPLTKRTDQIKQLRQAILNLAVRGKLVEQDPNDEPAAYILAKHGVRGVENGAFDLPDSWQWVEVQTVAQSRLGKMLDKGKNKGIPKPYLRNINVRWFEFDLHNLLKMPFEDRELDEFSLLPGDVLICEGGEPGRAAVWRKEGSGIYFQKALHRVRFVKGVNSDYFVNALKASANDCRLEGYFTGTGIKHFTGRSLDAYQFPLPPLAEQHRIVAKVNELMALCDQLEASLTQGELTRSKLLEAVLHQALEPA